MVNAYHRDTETFQGTSYARCTSAYSAVEEAFSSFFHLICLISKLTVELPGTSGLTLPPCLLLLSPGCIPLLSHCWSTTEKRTAGFLGREGKASLHLTQSSASKLAHEKEKQKEKEKHWNKKGGGKGRGYRSCLISVRRVKGAAHGRKTHVLCPTWWQCLLKCRDGKLTQRIHFVWVCNV